MSKVTGVLESISAKAGISKAGKPWTAYSLQVNSGNAKNWYRYGFDAPTAKEGSLISFEAIEDKPGMFTIKSDLTVEKATPATAAVTASFAAVADNKQNSIVRQNATSTAAQLVSDMITHGAIKLPAKGNNYDLYLGYVKELSEVIFLQNIQPESREELLEKRGEGDDATDESAEYWKEGDDEA